MTDREKLDKLVAEIKRRYKECKGATPATEYQELLDFIDSMQKEPKDKCKGCNNVKGCITCVDGSEYAHIEECNITGIKSKHATGKLKELVDNVSEEGLKEARKQLEELTKECMYSKDNYTDEDRKVLCDGCEEECEYAQNGKPVSEDLQKAMYLDENGNPTPAKETEYTKGFLKGANWQKEKDDEEKVLIYKRGFEDCKEQMIKDAVDATIMHFFSTSDNNTPKGRVIFCSNTLDNYKTKEKIKLVIIKKG